MLTIEKGGMFTEFKFYNLTISPNIRTFNLNWETISLKSPQTVKKGQLKHNLNKKNCKLIWEKIYFTARRILFSLYKRKSDWLFKKKFIPKKEKKILMLVFLWFTKFKYYIWLFYILNGDHLLRSQFQAKHYELDGGKCF